MASALTAARYQQVNNGFCRAVVSMIIYTRRFASVGLRHPKY